MSELVFIHAYTNRFEAEQAQEYLQNLGIDAMVMADDGGGMYAGLSLGRKGVRLLVREDDEGRAREALQPGVIIDPMEAASPGAGPEAVPAPLVAAEAAARFFDAGNNCAESVLRAFAADNELEADLVRLATGFGGGMGLTGGPCGALTGAVMAIGMYHGRLDGRDEAAAGRCDALVSELHARFREACGATDCRDLLGTDLVTDTGLADYEARNLHATVCRKCVWESAHITATLLAG